MLCLIKQWQADFYSNFFISSFNIFSCSFYIRNFFLIQPASWLHKSMLVSLSCSICKTPSNSTQTPPLFYFFFFFFWCFFSLSGSMNHGKKNIFHESKIPFNQSFDKPFILILQNHPNIFIHYYTHCIYQLTTVIKICNSLFFFLYLISKSNSHSMALLLYLINQFISV